jgi:hypothetical protein
MVRPLPVLLAVLAGFAVASACYSERQPPPTFRYACNSDADCDNSERCMNSLCQVPCSQATAEDVCTSDNHLLCFNGACATGCDPEDADACPTAQQCVNLGIEVSQSGFGGGGTTQFLGVCGIACTETSCPTGEACLEGFCLELCDDDDDCSVAANCTGGVCIPVTATTGGDDDAATSDDDEGGSTDAASGDSTASSGGGT